MQVDLEAEGTNVEGLPRFQQAVFHGRRLKRVGIGLASLAAAGLLLAFFVGLFAPQSIWPPLLVSQSSALIVVVAGLQSAWWITQWRARALVEPVVVLAAEQLEPIEADRKSVV